MLERVAGRSRRTLVPGLPPYAKHVLASRPLAYWRLEEMESATAHDATGRENHGQYENGVAFFLSGADLPGLMTGKRINRAPHLAGGRLAASIEIPAEAYSIEFWFWNGLPNDARPVTGYLFGRASNRQGGDYLGLNGSSGLGPPGCLFASQGLGEKVLAGKSAIGPRTWHHVVLTRNGRHIAVHLDGNDRPEIAGDVAAGQGSKLATIYLGGRYAHEATFEGKIDEVAVYDRPLTLAEIVEHFRAAGEQFVHPDHW
ncbi:MAG: LamG domain-containing protein [Isosphaeraceae bacterium]